MSLARVGPNQVRPMLALLQKNTTFYLTHLSNQGRTYPHTHTRAARLWPGLQGRDHKDGINTFMLQLWWSVWSVSPPGWTSTCVWSTTATETWRFACWAWGLACWARPWVSCPCTLPWQACRSMIAPPLYLALRYHVFSPATLQVNSSQSQLQTCFMWGSNQLCLF